MQQEFETWRAAGHNVEIAYNAAAMESMRRAAVVGLQKIPKRGLEVGGVLFGKREGGRIEIHQWREIECEHALGPGFELSGSDRSRLTKFLGEAAHDPDLSKFDTVGWFRTRTRGSVFLSESDLKIYNELFPEPWQICLVIRPFMYEPAAAGFFFRETDGKIHAEASRNEFQLENKRQRVPLGFDPSQPPRRPAEPETNAWIRPAPAVPPPAEPLQAEPRTEAPRPPTSLPSPPLPPANPRPPLRPLAPARKRARRRTVAIAAAALLLVIAGIALGVPAFYMEDELTAGLVVRDVGGQLILEWNRNAPLIDTAAGASVEIEDGGSTRAIELSPEEIRGGTLVYQRNSGEVMLRLSVRGADGRIVSEFAHFVGDDPVPSSAAPQDDLLLETMREERDQLQQRLDLETERSATLEAAIAAEKRRLGGGN